jgi:RNA polymerase sigma-70 factor, ECF subfamily
LAIVDCLYSSMEGQLPVDALGVFDARYVAFLETITSLRPRLHRYCSRMTGSVLDGEDVVQEALFQAYRRLETFDDSQPLSPWLFKIAHNRCIDFLRHRRVRCKAEAEAAAPDFVPPIDPSEPALSRAVEHLVLRLPPKERACVLLKDVFDYSLEEIAAVVGSTVGAVKAALSRGRTKLAARPARAGSAPAGDAESARILHLYTERFKRRDWDGLRELIAADARLQVADRFAGRVDESPYFGNYERQTVPWRMAPGEVDGELAVIILGREANAWVPRAAVRLEVVGGRVERIVDYSHCPWILAAASSVVVGEPS